MLLWAVARLFTERGVDSILLWVFADNQPSRGFSQSLGGVLVAEDGFELGGAWLLEVAYGGKNLDVLLARSAGG